MFKAGYDLAQNRQNETEHAPIATKHNGLDEKA